tara:strand:- start:148 stop:423 length:276 start_codon:yes stop_codon:yes gene_type:complete
VESRKEFINRMMWMIREIESSKFNSLESLPMLELELKMRDVKLIKNIKSIISNFLYLESLDNKKTKYFKKNMKDMSLKVEIKINEIIKELE